MCSATQDGLRVLRSKEEVSEAAGRRSATGPGKPYWKIPAGSTGPVTAFVGKMGAAGGGALAPLLVVLTDVVVVAIEGLGVSLRDANIEAVTAAPVAALAAAIRAKVAFDMAFRRAF